MFIRNRSLGKNFVLAGELILIFCFFLSVAAAETKDSQSPNKEPALTRYEETRGIRPLKVQLSAGGYMLDFRYHVSDTEKAAPLFSSQIKPYLIDQKSGTKSFVSETPRFGALRQTRKPDSDKDYYIIFGNPAQRVKRGDTVTVVIGDLEIKDLIVR